jgi:hypothetical protein
MNRIPWRRASNLPVPTVSYKRNGPTLDVENRPVFIGRDDWIRTSDPLTPSQVRYQAALHPVSVQFFFRRALGGGAATFSSNGSGSAGGVDAGVFASMTDSSRSPRFT